MTRPFHHRNTSTSAPAPIAVMTNKKYSDLTATTSVASGDIFAMENVGGNSRKITGGNLAAGLQALVSFIGAVAYNSTTQSISNATSTALTFDSEDIDSGSIHSTSSNTSRLTADRTGKWRIDLNATWATNATNSRYITIRKNAAGSGSGGTALRGGTTIVSGSSAGSRTNNQTVVASLASGDYVEAFAYQDSGGALNIGSSANAEQMTTFSMVYLGP